MKEKSNYLEIKLGFFFNPLLRLTCRNSDDLDLIAAELSGWRNIPILFTSFTESVANYIGYFSKRTEQRTPLQKHLMKFDTECDW